MPLDAASWADDDAADAVCWRRRPLDQSSALDITPMIDVTFLLLVFFLLTSALDPRRAVDLPPAVYGVAVASRNATFVTVAQGAEGVAEVYLGAEKSPRFRVGGDPAAQERAVREAVARALLDEGRRDVILRAERRLAHRDVARIAAAIGEVDGVRLHLGVHEGAAP